MKASSIKLVKSESLSKASEARDVAGTAAEPPMTNVGPSVQLSEPIVGGIQRVQPDDATISGVEAEEAIVEPGNKSTGQIANLDVAEDSRCEGSLKSLEALLDHRVVTDIEYLSAARPGQ